MKYDKDQGWIFVKMCGFVTLVRCHYIVWHYFWECVALFVISCQIICDTILQGWVTKWGKNDNNLLWFFEFSSWERCDTFVGCHNHFGGNVGVRGNKNLGGEPSEPGVTRWQQKWQQSLWWPLVRRHLSTCCRDKTKHSKIKSEEIQEIRLI